MSALGDLQSARSRRDLATLLGYQLKTLTYLVFQLPDPIKYVDFEIPKRSGGVRSISAPEQRLKVLQQRLAALLYACLDELEPPPRRRTLSHGFVRERSILTNARAHRGRRHVLNVDLADFFPTINFGRVRGVLMKDRRFLLDERVATLIAQIACRDGVLPQGAPSSPVLSNIVGHLLDIRMARLSRHHGCRYTRYADDLTFSTNEKEFPAGMAVAVGAAGDVWQAGPDLVDAVTRAGYALNPAKTRLQSNQSRQTVTGLVVNQQVNVRSEYYRTVRSMCSELFNTGSYYRMLPAHFAGGAAGDPDVKDVRAGRAGLAPLQGMLEHVYQVRNHYDERDSKEKKADPTATRKLYHKFLFYRSFVALERPLVIPEGKTDTIYLKAAIERLPAFHPRLGEVVGGVHRHALDFQRFSSKVHDILQLGGGTGDFLFFMKSYRSNLDRYRFRAMRQPVILLIDNDGGADNVFKEALKLGVPAIALKTTEPFYRLVDNLYLVKTDERGVSGKTCIEDLFDPALLKTKVNGLEFDPAKKHNAVGKYGKQIFAESVVKPNAATIDFSGFERILERIVAVLDDYAAAPSPAP